jgi:branched-chain amino acid transport system ATP-binding protein
LLAVSGLDVYYGDLHILWDVSLEVAPGSVTTLIGSNGAGKTTLLKTISGLLRPRVGAIRLDGEPIEGREPHRIAARGVAHVPEGRRIFPMMTVAENLALGAYHPAVRAREPQNLDWVLTLFPVLRQRLDQLAGTMSGGEQQMLAIGRALMMEPKLVLMDEPSQGLQPTLVTLLFETIRKITERGLTVLLVEQNVQESLEIADRFYILETGRVVRTGESREMLTDAHLREAYLGL